MANELAVVEKRVQELSSTFSRNRVDPEMKFAREKAFAMQIFRGNPYLLRCDIGTVQDAILNVALTGTTLDPAEKLAYLVPRKRTIKVGNEKKQILSCCLDISYRGLVRKAEESAGIAWIRADVVYSNDEFEYISGSNPEIKHKPLVTGDRGDFVGAYVICKTASGDLLPTWMRADEIEEVRQKSENPDGPYSPWTTFADEMRKKTVIKRGSKTWPKSSALSRALEVLEQHEGLREEYTRPQKPKDVEGERVITESERKHLLNLLRRKYDDEGVERQVARLCQRFGIQSLDELPYDKYKGVLKTIEQAVSA